MDENLIPLMFDRVCGIAFDLGSSMNHWLMTQHPNPLARYGKQSYSQVYEDGITIEILRRLGNSVSNKFFLEIGCGNGTQNNTIILAAMGWDGIWVDSDDLIYALPERSRVEFVRERIDDLSASVIAKRELYKRNIDNYGAVSIDVDGIDLYVVQSLLRNGIFPDLWIVEYNALFPPPVKFCIEYDSEFRWDGSTYFGASLQSFVDLMQGYGYQLVCCTPAAGTNAFFVRNERMQLFHDVPKDICDIFVGPHYRLDINYGHGYTPKTIQHILNKDIANIK